eukprot:12392530-Ditylum_brightwellii.AAC.1
MSDGFKDIVEAHISLAVVEECFTIHFCHRADSVFEYFTFNDNQDVMRVAVITQCMGNGST